MAPRETFQKVHADTKDNVQGMCSRWGEVGESVMFSVVCSFVLAELASENRSAEQMIGANAALTKLKEFSKLAEKPVMPGTIPSKQLTTYA